MSKAPTENQHMQAVKPRPWDSVTDMQSLNNDWLTPRGKARAKLAESHRQRHKEYLASLKNPTS
jgi:hypothetical protein